MKVYLNERQCTFMSKSRWFILGMRYILDRSCTENKNTFNSVTFPEYCAVYEIKWKSFVKPDRPQMTRWRMRITYLVTNATDKHLRIYNLLLLLLLILLLLLLPLSLQPWVGLGLFNNSIPLLSILDLRPPTVFILFRSSSTWSIHLNLGLHTGLVLYDVHSVIFLVLLVFSILITWAAHISLCDFINFIISSCFILCFNSWFVLILHVPSGFCVGP